MRWSTPCSSPPCTCTAAPPSTPVPARAPRADLEPADRPRQGLDLELPLEEAAEGYKAMDERRAIKTLLSRDQQSDEEETT
jgi:hypothetical protein